MTYPGGKNGSGAFQRIINHMPPHAAYIEAFTGSGAVMRNKRPAETNIGIDRSQDALKLCHDLAGESVDGFELMNGCALKLLPSLKSSVPESILIERPDTLIYADPPYLPETRKSGDLYEFEMGLSDHVRLLDILTGAKCMVMISGYRSALYDEALSEFTRIDYRANTRRGLVDESLWMNFPMPSQLHDYSHLGENYRDRERIKRKKARWVAKISRMDRLERLAVMDALSQLEGGHGV